MQECKNIEIFKSVKNDLGAANFKRNKITLNGVLSVGIFEKRHGHTQIPALVPVALEQGKQFR